MKCQPKCQKCEQKCVLRVMLIKQSYRIGWKSDISLVVISTGSAETNIRWGGKLKGHLMASCIRNICTKNYQNLITGFSSNSQKCLGCFLRHLLLIFFFCFGYVRQPRLSWQLHSASVVCLSVCLSVWRLSLSCTLFKRLNEFRCYLAETLVGFSDTLRSMYC